jgi:very-short-patch-repair endonuclease
MRDGQKHSPPQLSGKRKILRENLTTAEAKLWSMLNNKRLLGRKFRRQHSIENYIADFYCASEKLIIELDGSVHVDGLRSAYDIVREMRLVNLGYKVLRFENKLVFDYPEAVLESIVCAFEKHE